MTTDKKTALGVCEGYVMIQIGGKLDVEDMKIVTGLVERWFDTALEVCNRNSAGIEMDMPLALLHIVADTVVGAYNTRGGEGMNSESAGVQSAQYQNLYEKMKSALISANLRLIKL